MSKKVDITYATVKASVAYQFARGEITWSEVQRGEITWSEVQATALDLNYYSLNRYLVDPLSLGDTTAVTFNKQDVETLTLSDAQQLSVQKQINEAFLVSDNVSILLIVERAFSDSSAISDVTVLAVEKELYDAVSVSEILSMAVSLSKTDSTSLADTQAITAEKSLNESLGVAESFSRTVIYSRNFTDAFSLDDIETHTNTAILNKTNVFGFNDSFTHVISRDNRAVLNTSSLNTFTFNS